MHVCVHACVHACMCVCVCVCVAKPVTVELWIHLYLNNRFFLGLPFSLWLWTIGYSAPGWARGQNLGHLKKSFFFAFIFLLCNQSYLKNRYYSGLTFSL